MQPDREEVITTIEDSESINLQTGVNFRPLVGDFNTARNLFFILRNNGNNNRFLF